jgi:hypothetical protein
MISSVSSGICLHAGVGVVSPTVTVTGRRDLHGAGLDLRLVHVRGVVSLLMAPSAIEVSLASTLIGAGGRARAAR